MQHIPGIYEKYIKRLLDIIVSLGIVIFFGWFMLIIGILVRIKLGEPIVFKQPRPGKDGKIFYMYKFRTMTNEKDEKGKLLSDNIRLTRFGKRLRETSCDELLEVINVLKGDMSLIGPRPQLVRDMVFMTSEQNRRHEVRQGITGWAQVNGRNAISWEDKLRYDVEYVNHISFLLDLKILFCTVKTVFTKEGITMQGMATAEDFGDYLLKSGKITQKEYEKKQLLACQIIEKQEIT